MNAVRSSGRDGAVQHQEWSELANYLGPEFDSSLGRDPELRLAEEYREAASDHSFYQTSGVYLYDLAAFAASGLKDPLRAAVRLLAPRGSALLDYGCGAGSDGLHFLERGYRVSFADFANPAVRYLEWRLRRRNRTAPIHDLAGERPAHCDLAYAFDVLEHVERPGDVLETLAELARVVVVNFVTTPEDEKHRFPMHRNHDWRAVLEPIARNHTLLADFALSPTSWYRLVAFRAAGAEPLSPAGERLVRLPERIPLRWRERALIGLARAWRSCSREAGGP